MSQPAVETAPSAHSRLALAGPAAAALFGASVLGFAAARTDGYSHATKAVSELGAVGAPSALAFNLLGFVLPGLLVVGLSYALARTLRVRTGPILLGLSGGALVLSGIFPADMAARGSAGTLLHGVGAMLSGLFWAASLFWLGPALARPPGLRAWGRMTPWFLLFLLANFAWQVTWQTTGAVLPGWGQRIAFFGYFLWLALTGMLVSRLGGRLR